VAAAANQHCAALGGRAGRGARCLETDEYPG